MTNNLRESRLYYTFLAESLQAQIEDILYTNQERSSIYCTLNNYIKTMNYVNFNMIDISDELKEDLILVYTKRMDKIFDAIEHLNLQITFKSYQMNSQKINENLYASIKKRERLKIIKEDI